MTPEPTDLAIRLAVAVNRVRSRMREEAGEGDRGITVSSIAMLQRLAETDAMSASTLAAREHVTQQAIAQRLDLLKPTGYIAIAPDPTDRRRKLVTITDAGREFLRTLSTSKEDWLARAIAAEVDASETPALEEAITLLDRLAAVDLRPESPLR